ncbi:putative transcription repair coupling factor (fragment) [Bradyrhizobium sp. STM 3809]
MADQATRLAVYAQLAHAETSAEVDAIEDDIQLRFGPLPPEASHLIATARIGIDCRALGIARLDVGTSGIAARLRPATSAGPRRPGGARSRLVYKHEIHPGRILTATARFLAALKRVGTTGINPANASSPRKTSTRGPRQSRR